jgi:hypothetical protein
MGAEWQAMPIGFLSGGSPIRQRKLKSDGMEDCKISETQKYPPPLMTILALAFDHLFVLLVIVAHKAISCQVHWDDTTL